jgi:DNA-directed RNA polymerase subunit F
VHLLRIKLIQIKEAIMSKVEKVTLIKGLFQHHEAREVLMNMFTTKISYHQLKNFSFSERFGKPDTEAQKKIKALKKEMAKLDKILMKPKAKKNNLLITSEINITISDDK